MMKFESMDAQTLGKKNYGAETLSNDVNPADASFSGLKHAHETESLDSDKDLVTIQQPGKMAGKQLIVTVTPQDGWTEEKRKKMGKKGKLEAYFHP